MPGTPAPIASGSVSLRTIEVAGLRLTDAVFPPLLVLPSHYHERTCFAVVLEGSLEKAFTRAGYHSPAATTITMPAQERHKDHFERAGAHMLVIEPDPDAEELTRPCAPLFSQVGHFRDGGVLALAWRISEELRSPDAFTHLAAEGLALEMLALAARRGDRPKSASGPPGWLAIVQEMLHERFAEPLRVGDLAAQAGVHPVHLARVFRRHFGESIGEYVRRLRLDWASVQLITSNEPLSDLAVLAGFADQSHFTRAFKHHTGLTPARYRQTRRPPANR